ncbi:MAG: 3D domain-containing protein [Bryobacteraceae bacterium]|nr:3D domain-containing protein [Bryobacteraceae bacterium]
MKLIVLLCLAAAACAEKPGRWQSFTATAYSVEGETSSGKQTREGRTVAADHSVLPVGTRIEVQDAGPYSGEYIVQDSGPKIRGREIDIFIDNPAEAKKFGKKTVRVRVLAKPKQEAAKR